MSTETRQAIESILMVAEQPVEPSVLAQLLETPKAEIEAMCAELADEYEAAQRGFILARVAGGYRFQSHPDLAPYVERFVLDGQSSRLSSAALETLAIVAYKQPISRMQIAAIRGVNVDGVLRTLQQRGYVDEVSRDPGPGNAVLFGTTDLFLERVGLDSTDDLPPLAEFVPGADVVEALEDGLRPDPVEVPASTTTAATEEAVADEPADTAADASAESGDDPAQPSGSDGPAATTDDAPASSDSEADVDVSEHDVVAVPGDPDVAVSEGDVGDVPGDADVELSEDDVGAVPGGADVGVAAVTAVSEDDGDAVPGDADADVGVADDGALGEAEPPAPSDALDATELSADDAAAMLADRNVEAGDLVVPEIELDAPDQVIDLVAAEGEPATVHRPTELQEELAALDALQHGADATAPGDAMQTVGNSEAPEPGEVLDTVETTPDTWLPAESSVVATVRHDDDADHAEADPPAAPFRSAPGLGGAGTASEAVAPGEDLAEADPAAPMSGGAPDGG